MTPASLNFIAYRQNDYAFAFILKNTAGDPFDMSLISDITMRVFRSGRESAPLFDISIDVTASTLSGRITATQTESIRALIPYYEITVIIGTERRTLFNGSITTNDASTGQGSTQFAVDAVVDLSTLQVTVSIPEQGAIALDAAGRAETAATTSTEQATIATTQAGIATTKAAEAVISADTASTQAGVATVQAGISTDQAVIATTKAGEADASATTATEQATISTEQATIATDKAVIATDKAAIATEQATTATEQADIATTQAGIATTQAGIATDAQIETTAVRDNVVSVFAGTITVIAVEDDYIEFFAVDPSSVTLADEIMNGATGSEITVPIINLSNINTINPD